MKGGVIMFSKMSVGMKITGGFILLIVIIVTVGFIGFNGLGNVSSIVTKSDDSSVIIKYILQCRRAEKNFIIRGDNQYVDQVNETVNKLIELANATKGILKVEADRQLMDKIIAATNSYHKAFKSYIDGLEKMKKIDESLVNSARKVEDNCLKIRETVKKDLANLMVAGKTGSVLANEIE